MLVVCLGGARSGKTSFALERAIAHERATGDPVVYVATSPPIEGDDDFAERVEAHRDERPDWWTTIEEQVDLVGALDRCEQAFVVVDCLTLWVNNLMWRGHDDREVLALTCETATRAAARSATTFVVSNEVGLGVHPTTDAGRRYRDLLGRVNRMWVDAADRALLMVAGRAVQLHDPDDLL